MRKTRIGGQGIESGSKSHDEWLNLEATSVVEVTLRTQTFRSNSLLPRKGDMAGAQRSRGNRSYG
jgi:hypothetical protein